MPRNSRVDCVEGRWASGRRLDISRQTVRITTGTAAVAMQRNDAAPPATASRSQNANNLDSLRQNAGFATSPPFPQV